MRVGDGASVLGIGPRPAVVTIEGTLAGYVIRVEEGEHERT
ncbi:hypothetical protein [Halalkalicoccus sp. NIPERK01]|nr:hypothetical protein [Halalkalicoccus sp. NIPERK01]MDL5361150.1 hypothetical protein [Halalkalicoccus sp. NIPERK01]